MMEWFRRRRDLPPNRPGFLRFKKKQHDFVIRELTEALGDDPALLRAGIETAKVRFRMRISEFTEQI